MEHFDEKCAPTSQSQLTVPYSGIPGFQQIHMHRICRITKVISALNYQFLQDSNVYITKLD